MSTSHLSDLLVDSILAGEAGDKILDRYLRAREVRARVDDHGQTFGRVVQHMEKLVSDLEHLQTVIRVYLLDDSTSKTGMLIDAINAIFGQTVNASLELRQQLLGNVTSVEGCWTETRESVRKFVRHARLAAGLLTQLNVTDQPSIAKVFAVDFAQLLSWNVLEAPLAVTSFIEAINRMCMEAERVKAVTVRLLGDSRCDHTELCSKYNFLRSMSSHHLISKIVYDVENITLVADWLVGLLDEDAIDVANDTIFNIGPWIRQRYKDLYSLLLNTPSPFDIGHCETDVDKEYGEMRSRLTDPSLLNVSVSLSSSTVDGGQLSVAALDRSIRLMKNLSKAFEHGHITKVGCFTALLITSSSMLQWNSKKRIVLCLIICSDGMHIS